MAAAAWGSGEGVVEAGAAGMAGGKRREEREEARKKEEGIAKGWDGGGIIPNSRQRERKSKFTDIWGAIGSEKRSKRKQEAGDERPAWLMW